MSVDNGLLIEKVGFNKFDIYYIAADNKIFDHQEKNIFNVLKYVQEMQESSLLEYGTRFIGF